jgi:uncharacterized protein (UPF0335 family)
MSTTKTDGVAADKLISVVQRFERLEAERAELAADIREILSDAAGSGLCKKTIRALIKERKLDPVERNEQLELLDLYRRALEGTPTPIEQVINSKEEQVAA